MKNSFKSIGLVIAAIVFLYICIATYLLYSDYRFSLDRTVKTSDYYAIHKAEQISSYINMSVANASTISEMLAAAKEKYDYGMLPYVETAIKNFVTENNDILSVTLTWEYAEVDRLWSKPTGRLVEKFYMRDGLACFSRDTVDLDGEYVSENYYQMKNGATHVLFTNPYMNISDYVSKSEAKLCYSITTRIVLEGRFLGMVTIEQPVSNLYSMMSDMPLDYAGKPFIVADNGKIYGHKNSDYDNTLFMDVYSGIDRNDEIVKVLNDGIIGSSDFADSTHLTLIPIAVKDNGRPWTLVSEISLGRILKQSGRKVAPFIFLSFLGLALMTVFVLFFVRKNTSPLRQVGIVLRQIDRGEYEKIEKLESNDSEIQECYEAVNILADKISKTTAFANSIGHGDLNEKYNIDNPNALDLALLDMQKNLLRARRDEENRKVENEKLSWSQNGLAQLGEYLRMNNADINEFSFNVISFLVKYMGALQGGLFVTEEKDGIKYLDLKSAYAFDRKKQLEGRVQFGESLVGRCAIEGKSIFLTDVPDGYLYITSGLGENKPSCILLVPLKFEDEVHGVIEIASLKMIEEYQKVFLDNVSERIASTISNIKKNINTAELLEKFRTQSDALAVREQEIEKSYKDIKRSKEEIKLNELETEAILEVLSQSCIIMRYDTSGLITDIRDLTLEVTGYKRSDIVGHYLKEILALTKNDMDNFDIFWNEIIQGVKKTRKFTRGETLYKETFTLITDENGSPFKVISVAVPV
ncbi:MAG: GAF domain-containing protein [Bacteroidales bacterium]|nr:GAF domain-containing protein [Bacteroidales bacterium]